MFRPFLADRSIVDFLIGAGILIKSSYQPRNGEWALIGKTTDGRICVGGLGSFNGSQYDKITTQVEALNRCKL